MNELVPASTNNVSNAPFTLSDDNTSEQQNGKRISVDGVKAYDAILN